MPKVTAKEILDALITKSNKRDGGGVWIVLPEFRVGTGKSDIIDLWIMNVWRKGDVHQRIAYEIKVSKSDFCGEKASAKKNRMTKFFCTEFYYVTPKGLIDARSIPEGCGLIEYKADREYSLWTILQPIPRDNAPNWNFVAGLLRRVKRDNNA